MKSKIKLDGYHKPLHVSKINRASGVMVYVLNNLLYQELEVHTSIEHISLKIWNASFNITLTCLYRSPSSCTDYFFNDLECLLTYYEEITSPVYIVGDMNIDLLRKCSVSRKYLELLQIHGFCQNITEPTRVTPTSISLIDHIITKQCDDSNHINGVMKTVVTDHFSTFFEVSGSLIDDNSNSKRSLSFLNNSALKNSFSSECSKLFQNFSLVNLNNDCQQFINDLNKCIDTFATQKKINRNQRKPPWYDNSIKNLICKRNKVHKKCLINSSIENMATLKRLKLQCNSLMKLKKRAYYDKLFTCSLDNKRMFFKNLNNTCGRKHNLVSPKAINFNNELVTDVVKLSELFNHFFVNIANDITKDLPQQCPQPNLIEYTPFSMYLTPTSTLEVRQIIESLKSYKSRGIDDIAAEVYKTLQDDVLNAITNMINNSLIMGIFPDCLKVAKVFPVFKTGDRQSLNNYRPISVLPVLSKVFERVLYKRLYTFMETFKLFSENQFGFRTKRSTVDAILEITEKIRSNENNSAVMCLFLDLKKAFDTIDHEILVLKLERYGIRGPALNIIVSYLKNRKQYVEIDGIKSSFQPINKGVPQGSILGPLLFLIYINDLERICSVFKPTFFADDTNLTLAWDKRFELPHTVTDELKKINQWFTANKMVLNAKKTELVLFRSNNVQSICLANEDINPSRSSKYLGVIIDDKLKFSYHIEQICKRISKHLSVVSRLRHFVSKSVLYSYYNFYVRPVLQYGILIYGSTCTTHLSKLCKLQRKIIRLIHFKKKQHAVDNEMISNKILSVQQLYVYEVIKFSLRSVRKEISSNYLNELFQKTEGQRITRGQSMGKFRLQKFTNNWGKFSLRVRGAKLLNFLIDNGLYPDNLLELSPSQLNDLIHSYKNTILLIPDDQISLII